ncbi:hypothetical protein NE237_023278 [Protea cynaroides]|uniref:C2H2-type domain-containing protein n=1 Tax=Protea cynaroides TaxID=273540 RepID=A0A9Q0HGU4_9MAGN|nr:hypothetical protein NE237_023278 [Protea cynaroides]
MSDIYQLFDDWNLKYRFEDSSRQRMHMALQRQSWKRNYQSVSCSFCHKKFNNRQALGGHQNLHRREIDNMRKEHEESMRRYKREREEKRFSLASRTLSPNLGPSTVNRDQVMQNHVTLAQDYLKSMVNGEAMNDYTKPFLNQLEKQLEDPKDQKKGLDLSLRL